MLQILINGIPTNLLQPHQGVVNSISIQKHPMVHIPLDLPTAQAVIAWLRDLLIRCTDDALISYNGVLMYKEDCDVS